jgi:CxxC-x17-CxxC domain-containing protein
MTMDYGRDKAITCKECGSRFIFSVSEQRFFASKNYAQPRRCRECRQGARLGTSPPHISTSSGVETVVDCSECGKETTVPFRPTPGRPVFCSECFHEHRNSTSSHIAI